MSSSGLPLFFTLLCLSLSGTLAAQPKVVLSSNATSVEAGGAPVKLTCSLENYVPAEDVDFAVFFNLDTDWFAFYDIFPPSKSGIPGQSKTVFINGTGYTPTDGREPSLGRQPLSYTFPVYEITVTPTVVGTQKYSCKLLQVDMKLDVHAKPTVSVKSEHLSITATPARLLDQI